MQEELPISPQFNTDNQDINTNDDALDEIELSDEDDEDVDTEARQVRVPKDPRQPSKQ